MRDALIDTLGEANLIICAIFDSSGDLKYGNQIYHRLFKGALGENYLKFIWPTHAQRIEVVCEKARLVPGSLHTCSVKAFTTGHVWALFGFELYVREDGNIGILGVKLPDDLSDDALTKDELQVRLREIAFIQSHEFRPPVARILGLSDMQTASNSLEEIKQYALLMRSSAEELDKFIHEITKRTQN